MDTIDHVFIQYMNFGRGQVLGYEWLRPRKGCSGYHGCYAAAPANTCGSFEGDLKLSYIDGHEWELLEPFSYISRAGDKYTSEKGDHTDFASIPRILWAILPPTGSYGPAAVIHDKLCGTAGFSRDKADYLFLEMLEVLNVHPVKRWVLYRGVRIGTWWVNLKAKFC